MKREKRKESLQILDLQRLASLTVLMYFNLRSGSIFERENVWKLLKLGR